MLGPFGTVGACEVLHKYVLWLRGATGSSSRMSSRCGIWALLEGAQAQPHCWRSPYYTETACLLLRKRIVGRGLWYISI